MSVETLNLVAAIEAAAARLDAAGVSYGHGTTNAFDEAAWLVLWRLGLPLDALDEVAERLLNADEQAAIDALIQQRIDSRRPAAYLTQEAWLQGVSFHVDERVIVPRSLIAEPLADGTLDAWLSEHTRQVLDLCTGNGSLAVLAAMAWPEVQVDAADISDDALAVARINVDRHGLADRIRLLHSDGLAALPGPYDLVLCNPPYVNSASMAALPAEYRAEPALALAGGEDGMDFIRRLLAELPQRLSPHGVLVLEIGHEREHFEAAFPALAPVWLPTSAGDDQVLLLDRDALGALSVS
ncbi:50S ribosomal protein L3 N(5)-glutamine methyltransferase [Aquincola tertiaricarbonis]|uniref:50S ribosomal protein L3 N(5)-glutamine methyltransferase n=1 Tax=Aquincola tertiaricarbonis TaxID=391953 RepID=A0ABY4SDX9_AQUTE|nr:50S ribosomal protein L3 N(5)-glutamine methyltransferase [Aquincola tertiaricarbonis]URI11188.1 50S ribosomal protein L3 N(5)-glutamine methyltransferase [Aquincola tertiaricarbonis]